MIDKMRNNAIRRFAECHIGILPEDAGYNWVGMHKDVYVFGKTEKSIQAFLRLEKLAKAFKIVTPILVTLCLLSLTWVILTQSLASTICLIICICCGCAGVAYLIICTNVCLREVLYNVTTVKIKED